MGSKPQEPFGEMLEDVRALLIDVFPSQYNFQVPQDERYISGLNDLTKMIWSDSLLVRYIKLSHKKLCIYPPRVDPPINSLSNAEYYIVIIGTVEIALKAISIYWASESFEYSIGGQNLSISAFDKYQTLLSTISQEWTTLVENHKAGQLEIVGLTNSRFIPGSSSFFGSSRISRFGSSGLRSMIAGF